MAKIIIPVFSDYTLVHIKAVEDLILSEVNVKTIEYLTDSTGILIKKIKPNFKSLGPKYGKMMKQLANAIQDIDQDDIKKLEDKGYFSLIIGDDNFEITLDDVEISTEDIPGWSVANDGQTTVALDITVTPELREEGLAREFVNRIQNLRKDKGYEVTDRIKLLVENNELTNNALINFNDYICSETLADLNFTEKVEHNGIEEVELLEGVSVALVISKQ